MTSFGPTHNTLSVCQKTNSAITLNRRATNGAVSNFYNSLDPNFDHLHSFYSTIQLKETTAPDSKKKPKNQYPQKNQSISPSANDVKIADEQQNRKHILAKGEWDTDIEISNDNLKTFRKFSP